MPAHQARSSRAGFILTLAALLLLSPGCLVRQFKIIRPGLAPAAKLRDATLPELLDYLKTRDQSIRSLQITVNMEPSLGSVQKGEVAELKDVRGFILLRKPADIRMIGLYPVVRNRAFDMVSNGIDFKLWVPVKNKFIVGKNELEELSPNKLENLRPAHILEALLVLPPADGEQALLENFTDEANADYIIHTVKQRGAGPVLYRNIWFDRIGLRIVRQEIFAENGDIVSDARYQNYENADGMSFPKVITIMRPKEEYGVKLTMVKVEVNLELGNDKFVLEQPAGSDLMDLSKRKPAPAAAPEKQGTGGKRG